MPSSRGSWYLGSRALQCELILAKCGLDQLSGEQGLHLWAALCLCCFWLARLFTVPALLIYSMLWNYTRSSSVAGAVWSLGRVGEEEEGSFREKRLLQCFLTMPDLLWFLLCPFFNSWIEKSSLILSPCSPSIWRDLGFGDFYEYIVNQLQLIT